MTRLILRILLAILLFFCIVQGWWYFAIPLAILGLWSFGMYVEIILAGLIYDALFGSVTVKGIEGSIGLIIGVILFVTLTVIKRMVRIRE